MDVEILSENFAEFQKEIFQEHFAQLQEDISAKENISENEIKPIFENILQNLNSKLTVFGEKISKTEFFPIKWSIKIYSGDILLASLIGNTSILIFREGGLYYSVNNEYGQQWKIDLFSEFIEWEIQNGDNIIALGNDIHVVFDKKEVKKFNEIFIQGGHETMDFLEETLSMRIDQKEISFLIQDNVDGMKAPASSRRMQSGQWRKSRMPNINEVLSTSKTNKYWVVVSILGLLTLVLIWSAIKTSGWNQKPIYVDQAGNEKVISPDQIKKDITHFQKLDPTSNQKSHLYREIITQLDRLESQEYRPEDIEQRRRILEQHYNKGFNIVYETDLSNFDDWLTNTKAQLLAFNENEISTLWTLNSLVVTYQILVWWESWAIIAPVNNDVRGTLVAANDEWTFEWCASNILRDGLYCYDEIGNITNITKAGSIDVTTESPWWFPSNIAGLDIFGKTNLYVLNNDTFENEDGVFITRYRNIVGTQNQFQIGDDYTLPLLSWDQTPEISNFSIDGNFLVWNNQTKTIQQRWREWVTFSLNSRDIEVIGWTENFQDMGSNVKILSTINTKYVLLFDQDNQSLTVYDSTWVKTNDAYTTTYSLRYLMKFKFDLKNEYLLDMAISDTDGNQLRLYMLSDVGIYKIALYDFIEKVQDSEE